MSSSSSSSPVLCQSWLYDGGCSNMNCLLSHGLYEKSEAGPYVSDTKEKTVVCRRWIEGNCNFGQESKCHFAHGLLNLKFDKHSSCKDERSSLCSRWIFYGKCEYSQCRFAHGFKDLAFQEGNGPVSPQNLCLSWLMRSCNTRNCTRSHTLIARVSKAAAATSKAAAAAPAATPAATSKAAAAAQKAAKPASESPAPQASASAAAGSSRPAWASPAPAQVNSPSPAPSSPATPAAQAPAPAAPVAIVTPAPAPAPVLAAAPAPVPAPVPVPNPAPAPQQLNPVPTVVRTQPNVPFPTPYAPPGFPINPIAIAVAASYASNGDPSGFGSRPRERHDSTARHDASALYRDMHVSLCRMIRTLSTLLPAKIHQLCEQLVIPNNPLSRDLEEIASKVAKITESLLQQLADEMKGDGPRITGANGCRDFLLTKIREDTRQAFFFRSVTPFSIPAGESRIPDPVILYDSLDSLRYLVELYCSKEDHFQFQNALPPPYDIHQRRAF